MRSGAAPGAALGVTAGAPAGRATPRAALQAALAERLGSAREARWMLEEVLGDAAVADEDARAALDAMVERCRGGEPLQYVLGSWQFRTLELFVDPRALIPRPETEQVVEVALHEARRLAAALPPRSSLRVADLGTGTGAVALSIAAELGSQLALRVAATDRDPSALELAAANLARVAGRHPHVARQVELRQGSWYDALDPAWRAGLHLVVSNPPYVAEEEWQDLEPHVRREPRGALVAAAGRDGTPGFADVEAVLAGAVGWLVPGGAAVVEMAPHHAGPAARLAAAAGYAEVRVEHDLAGMARAVVARR